MASALWFFLALGVGAVIVKAVGLALRRSARRAVAQERRRIARDLHDHLAQEIAFVRLQSAQLAERRTKRPPSVTDLEQVAGAAEQALRDARRMIMDLTGTEPETRQVASEPLHVLIGRTAERLTARAGARLTLDLDPRADLPAKASEELIAILREALWNGVRHGNADTVSVVLSCEEGLRLRIADNGTGFDPEVLAASYSGFGIRGMVERAKAGGGELFLRSAPGRGTELEVVLP